MTKLSTAAEIAAMNLPNLPSTTRGIQLRAQKEEWRYETKVGLGGVRRMYEIPAYYLPGYNPYANEPVAPKTNVPATDAIKEGADQIAAQAADTLNTKIDPQRLSRAIQIVERYLEANKIHAPAERKSEVVVVVYNFLKSSHDQEEIDQLLKLVA